MPMAVAKERHRVCRSVCEPKESARGASNCPTGHDPNSFFVSGGNAHEFQLPVGASLPMRFRVAEQHELSNAHSPFRVIQQSGREVEWINRFLDQQRVRGVADSTLRSYAHDLLHFLRWWAAAHKTSAITKEALTESTFLDYIRCQVDQNPAPAAASVNRRVGTAERAMRL